MSVSTEGAWPVALLLALGPMRAGAELSVDHAAMSCIIADRHPVVEARFTPAAHVGRGRVYFRARATAHWYYVEMKGAGDPGVFAAPLPKPKASTPAIEYYVEATAIDFESRRTPEIEARVAAAERDCASTAAPMLSTATVAVGVVTRGAPAVPAGFSSAGVVAVAAPVAAGGGGFPVGLAAGGAAGAAAVSAGVLVLSSGEDDACPPASGAFHEIGLDCNGIQRDAKAGCPLGLQVGVGRWPTPDAMQQALAGHRAVITVDGEELAVTREGPTLHTGGGEASGFGDRARATWTATRGAHAVVGYWTVHPEAVSRCELVVGE